MGERYYRNKRYDNDYLDDDQKLFIGIAILVVGALIIGGIAWFINNIILPYIWWIVGVSGGILLITIGFLVYFKVIKKHNIKKLENFVAANSEAIKKLEELNSRLILKYVNNQIYLNKTYDIKRDYENVSPQGYLEYCLRENLVKYQQIYDDLVFNKETYSKYKEDVSKLRSNLYFTKEKCEELKKNLDKCRKYEIDLFESKIIKYFSDISITVTIRYRSKGGRVSLSKKDEFYWNEFCQTLDLVKKSRLDYEVYKRIEAVERALVTDELRFEIMKRDNYRCKICGASSEDGVQLHVDHIIPIAKGGKTEMSNLQTLCERCNRGKSDKLM